MEARSDPSLLGYLYPFHLQSSEKPAHDPILEAMEKHIEGRIHAQNSPL